jgi:membrane protein DedA with SNARE-associated domain
MEHLIPKLTDLFYAAPEFLRYVLIFLSSFIEGVPVIGSVFPGGTVALLIGSLSEGGFIRPLIAVLIITIGTFSGDMIGFAAGRHLKGHRWLKRFMEHEKHQKGWDIFDRHVAILIIFGKLIPVVRSTPSIFAAMRGMRLRRYVLYSGLGSIIWAFAGVYGGNVLARLLGENAAIILILGILVISGIIFVLQRFNVFKKKETVSKQ